MAFLPKLSDTTIQKANSRFQVEISNAVKHIDHVCCCCSRFVDPVEFNLIPDNEPILIVAFKTNILHCCGQDIYDYFETFNFCHDCWNQISRESKPNFGISNKMSQFSYVTRTILVC